MNLNYKVMGNGPALVVLHGLFGSLDNWLSLGKILGEDFTVFLVDQRNHGKSPHHDDWDYQYMADDLEAFMDQQGIYRANLLGHSMGGKTVMTFAQEYPERIDKLVVADMGIQTYQPHHTKILETLNTITPANLSSRQEADEAMKTGIPELSVRQFLLKNLKRNGNGGFEWKFNFPVIYEKYDLVLLGIDPEIEVDIETLFVYGGQSEYIIEEDLSDIMKLFPNAIFEKIPHAGHWLHADAPEDFLKIVQEYLLYN